MRTETTARKRLPQPTMGGGIFHELSQEQQQAFTEALLSLHRASLRSRTREPKVAALKKLTEVQVRDFCVHVHQAVSFGLIGADKLLNENDRFHLAHRQKKALDDFYDAIQNVKQSGVLDDECEIMRSAEILATEIGYQRSQEQGRGALHVFNELSEQSHPYSPLCNLQIKVQIASQYVAQIIERDYPESPPRGISNSHALTMARRVVKAWQIATREMPPRKKSGAGGGGWFDVVEIVNAHVIEPLAALQGVTPAQFIVTQTALDQAIATSNQPDFDCD